MTEKGAEASFSNHHIYKIYNKTIRNLCILFPLDLQIVYFPNKFKLIIYSNISIALEMFKMSSFRMVSNGGFIKYLPSCKNSKRLTKS